LETDLWLLLSKTKHLRFNQVYGPYPRGRLLLHEVERTQEEETPSASFESRTYETTSASGLLEMAKAVVRIGFILKKRSPLSLKVSTKRKCSHSSEKILTATRIPFGSAVVMIQFLSGMPIRCVNGRSRTVEQKSTVTLTHSWEPLKNP